jgi:uncharacterized protein (TIGR02147 family)
MRESTIRPVIFDYESVPKFVTDMLAWRRQTEVDFSVRTRLSNAPGCSPTLVSQVAKGARRLTRDRVDAFGKLLNLTNQEARYLDQWVALNRKVKPVAMKRAAAVKPAQDSTLAQKRPQNHLISHWLNPYVKEACRLAGFKLDAPTVHRLLGGIASVAQVGKSLEFLVREGFLRRTMAGQVVQNELQSATTDEIPDRKIAAFHKRALDLAKEGMDRYPFHERRAEAYVLPVNAKNLDKLKKILTECVDQVEQFEQDHPEENERLFQVLIHLTPVGGPADEMH